jgi:hypothetical protein
MGPAMTEASENKEFEYDVAFSFLKEDVALAVQLSDMLADRYKAFVYPREQEELAGTDGQETFMTVFRERARCVVVLYREKWGATPWTRVEQTAIKDRAMDKGWDFLLFVRLDAHAVMPKWLPRSQIWQDHQTYQASGTVAVISNLIQRSGGNPRVESLSDKADRIRREHEFETKRRQFVKSEKGVNSGRDRTQYLLGLLKEHAQTLDLQFKPSKIPFEACVFGSHAALMAQWFCRYANTTEGAYLEISYWNGHPPIWGAIFPFDQPQKIWSLRYEIDLTPSGEPAWRDTQDRQRILTPEAVAEHAMGVLLEKSRERMLAS